MVYLALKPTGLSSLKEISQAENIPFDYLEKILSQLEKSGFVSAKKGAYGGYYLKQPARKIKVGEVVLLLEGGITLVKCVGKGVCPRAGKCRAKSYWQKIQLAMTKALNSITLANLIK